MIQNQPFVSVVVPVFNGSKFLHPCLDALFASEYPHFEVIVVDDCSTDDSAEISLKKGAKVIPTLRQSGPAAARNFVAEKAQGGILLFVDADVVVKSDTIAKVANRFQNSPEISALFGTYDDEPGEKNFLSQYKNLCHHFVHQNSNSEASTFWTGLGAIRRDVFIAIGGFDSERFSVPSVEDIELGMRLRAAGHRILLDKEIQAKHLKKWKAKSLVQTDVFSRALPWSRLIMTRKGMVNDLNLKTADRFSAVLAGLCIGMFPFILWHPVLLLLVSILLFGVFFLNRKIFWFFSKKRGVFFAAKAFPWQLLYFFYSGVTFVSYWFWHTFSRNIGIRKREEIRRTHTIN